MYTGGDGTAYMGEGVMTKKQIKKRDEIADAIGKKDMKKRYGDENVRYAIATKLAMKEGKLKAAAKLIGATGAGLGISKLVDRKMKKVFGDPSKKLDKNSETFLKTGKMQEDISDEALLIQDWNVDEIKYTEVEAVDIIKPEPLKPSNWREDLDEDWQKVNRKDKTDGMSKAAVKAYRRENPGSKLKTAVTKDPKKLKKGSKSAKRRLAFCRRMKGMKKKLTSAKTSRDPDSRINKALRRWNCWWKLFNNFKKVKQMQSKLLLCSVKKVKKSLLNWWRKQKSFLEIKDLVSKLVIEDLII